MPGWLKTLKLICYVGAIIVAFSLLRNLGELTLAEMYGNAPAIFYGGGVCLVLWAVLFCIEKLKYKKVDDSGEIDKALESMEELNLRSEEQLGIPHDHKKVDVLSFRYTEKNGKIKIKEELFYKHMNNEMKLFRNGDDLCLADIDTVYSFPINDIKKYVLKKKKANMLSPEASPSTPSIRLIALMTKTMSTIDSSAPTSAGIRWRKNNPWKSCT